MNDFEESIRWKCARQRTICVFVFVFVFVFYICL